MPQNHFENLQAQLVGQSKISFAHDNIDLMQASVDVTVIESSFPSPSKKKERHAKSFFEALSGQAKSGSIEEETHPTDSLMETALESTAQDQSNRVTDLSDQHRARNLNIPTKFFGNRTASRNQRDSNLIPKRKSFKQSQLSPLEKSQNTAHQMDKAQSTKFSRTAHW